jgi:hypothetical protein
MKYEPRHINTPYIFSRQIEHPVSVCLEKTENKRGIDGDVKIIIHNCIQRRAYLNLDKTRKGFLFRL